MVHFEFIRNKPKQNKNGPIFTPPGKLLTNGHSGLGNSAIEIFDTVKLFGVYFYKKKNLGYNHLVSLTFQAIGVLDKSSFFYSLPVLDFNYIMHYFLSCKLLFCRLGCPDNNKYKYIARSTKESHPSCSGRTLQSTHRTTFHTFFHSFRSQCLCIPFSPQI